MEMKGGSFNGYPCGLWMLFHYLTVAAVERQQDPSQFWPYPAEFADTPSDELLSATRIMLAIRNLVDHFFRCEECREHFLQGYDRCDFGRCDIKANDYEALQLWLFNFHNGVTIRIIYEAYGLASTAASSSQIGEGMVNTKRSELRSDMEAYLWPNYDQCNMCYLHESPVVTEESANSLHFHTLPQSSSTDRISDVPTLTNEYSQVFKANDILAFLKESYFVKARVIETN